MKALLALLAFTQMASATTTVSGSSAPGSVAAKIYEILSLRADGKLAFDAGRGDSDEAIFNSMFKVVAASQSIALLDSQQSPQVMCDRSSGIPVCEICVYFTMNWLLSAAADNQYPGISISRPKVAEEHTVLKGSDGALTCTGYIGSEYPSYYCSMK